MADGLVIHRRDEPRHLRRHGSAIYPNATFAVRRVVNRDAARSRPAQVLTVAESSGEAVPRAPELSCVPRSGRRPVRTTTLRGRRCAIAELTARGSCPRTACLLGCSAYSDRSANIGGMDAARLAGISAATSAHSVNEPAATASAIGSQNVTPYNRAAISLPAPIASGAPRINPLATRVNALRSTRFSTAP